MRWPWRHRDEQGHARADAALERTREKREASRRKDAAGARLADRIRQMREANHLAEAIERALREGRG
jgi:hypothetical protein